MLLDDPRFERWYALTAGRLLAFDRNLALIAALPLRPGCGPTNMALSLLTGRLYVVDSSGGSISQGVPVPISLSLNVLDTATGAAVGTRDVTAAAGVPAGTFQCEGRLVTVLSAPAAPRSRSSAVVGRDVTLSWTRVGDATNLVLEAGLTPGRTAVSFSLGATSPVTIPNAPPGTYYLRVRGTNAFGVSRPSNEVVVTVP